MRNSPVVTGRETDIAYQKMNRVREKTYVTRADKRDHYRRCEDRRQQSCGDSVYDKHKDRGCQRYCGTDFKAGGGRM